MNDDFSKYESMRQGGSSPEEVYRQGSADGLDPIARIRLIRAVFALSLGQAKEVVVRAEGEADSLDQQQRQVADALASNRTTVPEPLEQRLGFERGH
jgi:hypothetical protein